MPSKPCTDHLGNKFDSITDMCRHWNISQTTFQNRQQRDWSLEESLCNKNNKSKPCSDHLGNKFNSQKEMCEYWNINQTTFRNRQKQGWSLKESLCGRRLYKNKKSCVDHLGNKFDSIEKMCQYWKINRATFRNRQKLGWSLEESLCTKAIKLSKQYTDHLGNKFDSITKMCQYWKIEPSIFRKRQEQGWSLEESLCKDNQTKNNVSTFLVTNLIHKEKCVNTGT